MIFHESLAYCTLIEKNLSHLSYVKHGPLLDHAAGARSISDSCMTYKDIHNNCNNNLKIKC